MSNKEILEVYLKEGETIKIKTSGPEDIKVTIEYVSGTSFKYKISEKSLEVSGESGKSSLLSYGEYNSDSIQRMMSPKMSMEQPVYPIQQQEVYDRFSPSRPIIPGYPIIRDQNYERRSPSPSVVPAYPIPHGHIYEKRSSSPTSSIRLHPSQSRTLSEEGDTSGQTSPSIQKLSPRQLSPLKL